MNMYNPNRKTNLISKIKNLFSKKKLLNITLSTLTIISLIGGMYFNSNKAQGVDFTFTQSTWAGGVSA